MTMPAKRLPELSGRRILLVEDELLVAMLLESALIDEGCVVVGPFARLRDALEAARRETVDAALLDVNLAGERVFPAAQALADRGVPFLLLSGYGDSVLPADRMHWQVCSKPFRINEVLSILQDLIEHRPD